MHEALEKRDDGGSGLVYSIVDRDDSGKIDDEVKGRFTWDVYHIENYLLDPKVVLAVLKNTTLQDTGFKDVTEIEETFREIAKGQIDRLVEHSLRNRGARCYRSSDQAKGRRGREEPSGEGKSAVRGFYWQIE